MKRCFTGRNLLFASAVSLVFPGLFAGNRAEGPSDYTIQSDVRLVLLDVSVKAPDGNLAPALAKEDFAVFENGKRQPITVFAHDDVPVTVGILVDESLSMTPKRPEVLLAAQIFVEESNPQDEMFVLNFNDKVTRGLPGQILFSDNLKQLRSALYRGIPQGKTALFDAVIDGLSQLEQGRRDKKTLVVISDGGDNASEHTRREMLELAERSIATIYAIGLYDADDPDRSPGILRQLARISGGEAYFPENKSAMTSICSRIAKDIRTRYTIGYIPQATNGSGSLRRIHVQVSAPGQARLSVRTRGSYHYDEISKASKE
jgi:Ca-activated chloride channel family protein